MRIGIDARMWSEAGNGRYLRNLIWELSKIDHKNEYVLFLLKKDFQKNLPKNFQQIEANFHWYTVKEQIALPKLIGKHQIDLMHFPQFNVPILYKGKFVVTIHDTTHQKFKMQRATTRNSIIYAVKNRAYNLAFKVAIKDSKKIITPSNYVKEELIKEWRVKPEKIVVTYEGAEENFAKESKKITKTKIDAVLEKLNIKSPFVFYIGNAHPHKNVEGLIKAFKILRQNYQYLTLVLSGKESFFWQRIKKEFNEKYINYTGFVTDEEYLAILKSAAVYVQPSFEEGFGIPLLEAFAVGTPVASSNAASLPEVGGDAAAYFNPKNSEDISNCLQKVLNDQKLRIQLIKKGQERYKKFSWKKMAQQTLRIYQEV